MKTYAGMVTVFRARSLTLAAEAKVEVHGHAGPLYLSTRADPWDTWSAPDLLALTGLDDPTISTIWDDLAAERNRAHALHGSKSMETRAPADESRLRILTEELGEVAREFNDAEINDRPVDLFTLREELVQLAAMAAAWADVLPRDPAESTTSSLAGQP